MSDYTDKILTEFIEQHAGEVIDYSGTYGPQSPDLAAALPKPEPCPDHIGEQAHNCRCCAADRKAQRTEPESENTQ